MKKKNLVIWNKIIKAKKLEDEGAKLLAEILSEFSENEIEIDLHASNSDNLSETIQCYINYGEDEEKIFEYLCERN